MAQILMLRKAHFFSLDNDLIDVHARSIGANGVAVYTALARFVNRKTGECWPSISTLAHLLDMARNTVKVALRTLEAAGLIAIRRRRDPAGDPTSHNYTLLNPTSQAVNARLAKRRMAAVETLDEGRSADDLPSVNHCPTGRSAIDPEPSSSEQKRENHTESAVCAEKDTPKAPTKNPCPHPLEERRHFGELTLCTHCYQTIDVHDETPAESATPDTEGQALAVGVA